ncbi:potassium channel family protein [Vibrio algarum]|uniref:Ion channel n=1 Tax=Vibrio algarum TaxID=3020714 RepID=A0ABT4YN61_9VIBR|nr:potassium channel family protein [Vibrio sp. KJ40-1]MDB1122963.1 ion channel [Vibrio sp. KJ40-1]
MKKHHIKDEVKPMSLMSLVLSFLSLFVISGLLFFKPSPDTYSLLIGIDTAICSLFLLQLTTDLIRSKNRLLYLKEHWIDFVASIPLIEPLRYGRIFQILRVIKVIQSGKHIFDQINRNRSEATFASILLLLIFLLTLGSTAILFVEASHPEANIKSAGDALWWSIVTVSTVGYGDHYPTTDIGKIIASAILICGVGIFGMISGLITSLIASPKSNRPYHQLAKNNELLEKLIADQKILIKRIDNLERSQNHKPDENR